MTDAKQQLQAALRQHVRDHGVIAGWRLNEFVGTLPDAFGEDVVLEWVREVVQPTGRVGWNTTLWIERESAAVEVVR